ncbi:MAG TPA: alanine racemase [Pseudolabrys sp.]|nr:alanine racemase [Pseudolabrys sp.]
MNDPLARLETPALLLDVDRLERNCARMRERCRDLGVALRPHLKTAKSLDVAKRALAGETPRITVSTLREAEYFAAAGYRDILYAATIVPQKLAHVARIKAATGCDLLLVTDSADVVAQASAFARERNIELPFLIEIDCGEHRSGLPAGDPAIVTLAKAITQAPGLTLRGVMSHAGHSYGTDDPKQVIAIAEDERRAAADAATAIRAAGIACEIVSVGSSPTALMARALPGVTEVRAGIYMVWDLSQLSRKMCRADEIAASVLASVIGHNRPGRSLIIDAGALALSKDIGANRFLPDAGYGYVCDPVSVERLGTLSVTVVHQEHGTIAIDDEAWFARLPVGSQVRILPNHACITCAGYDTFHVVRDGAVVDRWARINGW